MMANASDERLQKCATELQKGATSLDLPPETLDILNDLRKSMEDVVPTERKDEDSNETLYIYDVYDDVVSAKLSRSIAEHKVRTEHFALFSHIAN